MDGASIPLSMSPKVSLLSSPSSSSGLLFRACATSPSSSSSRGTVFSPSLLSRLKASVPSRVSLLRKLAALMFPTSGGSSTSSRHIWTSTLVWVLYLTETRTWSLRKKRMSFSRFSYSRCLSPNPDHHPTPHCGVALRWLHTDPVSATLRDHLRLGDGQPQVWLAMPTFLDELLRDAVGGVGHRRPHLVKA